MDDFIVGSGYYFFFLNDISLGNNEFYYSSEVNVNEEEKVKLVSYALYGHGCSAHVCHIGL